MNHDRPCSRERLSRVRARNRKCRKVASAGIFTWQYYKNLKQCNAAKEDVTRNKTCVDPSEACVAGQTRAKRHEASIRHWKYKQPRRRSSTCWALVNSSNRLKSSPSKLSITEAELVSATSPVTKKNSKLQWNSSPQRLRKNSASLWRHELHQRRGDDFSSTTCSADRICPPFWFESMLTKSYTKTTPY